MADSNLRAWDDIARDIITINDSFIRTERFKELKRKRLKPKKQSIASRKAVLTKKIKAHIMGKKILPSDELKSIINDRVSLEILASTYLKEDLKEALSRVEAYYKKLQDYGIDDVLDIKFDETTGKIYLPEEEFTWSVETLGIPPGTWVKKSDGFKKWVRDIFIPDNISWLTKNKSGKQIDVNNERWLNRIYNLVQRGIYKNGIETRRVRRDRNNKITGIEYPSGRVWLNENT